jgi:hypothetical protein
MDCERFEATLIDELYEELDELTSAAAQRHVAGCARCASLLGGLRATRRVAVLPLVDASLDLEDRILAAARNAQKVVPIGRRLSRAVSLAGSWAMRPQTAMAAVFILMVGSSVLFVRRSKIADSGRVTVTAHGQPASESSASTTTDLPTTPLDSKVAAAAHGAPNDYASAPAPNPAPASEGALASKDRLALPKGSIDSPGFGDEESSASGRRGASNASMLAGTPPPPPLARAPARDDSLGPSEAGGGKAAQSSGWGSAAGAVAGVPGSGGGQSGAADFGSALKAADITRDTNGCGAATDSYDRIAQQAWGTEAGYDATFKSGQCYQALGRYDAAKNDLALQRYRSLITVPKYAALAQEQINKLSGTQQSQGQLAGVRAATKKAPAKSSGPTPAAPAAPQATSAPPSAPAQSAPGTPTQQRAY